MATTLGYVCGACLDFIGLHTRLSKVLFAQKSCASQSKSNTFHGRENGGFIFQTAQRTFPALTMLSSGCKLRGFAELDCTQRLLMPKKTRDRSQCERAFLIL